MLFVFWAIEATDTHSGYVIINAFPLQQWLHERTSVLRYTYFALPVLFVFVTVNRHHLVFGVTIAVCPLSLLAV
jgi:hypothetical protein